VEIKIKNQKYYPGHELRHKISLISLIFLEKASTFRWWGTVLWWKSGF
jgi:hypothetical protein